MSDSSDSPTDDVSVKSLCGMFESKQQQEKDEHELAAQSVTSPGLARKLPPAHTGVTVATAAGVMQPVGRKSRKVQHGKSHPLTRLSTPCSPHSPHTISRGKFYSTM